MLTFKAKDGERAPLGLVNRIIQNCIVTSARRSFTSIDDGPAIHCFCPLEVAVHTVEKRSHTRVPVNIDVSCEPIQPSSVEPFTGVVADLSLGGLFVETASKPRVGTRVLLNMTFPGLKDPVSVEAYVRWTRDTGIGLQFGLLGARETHWLTKLMKRAS